MCSYLWGHFILDFGSDPESGILAGISGDKFSGTEENRNSGKFNIPVPDIRLNPNNFSGRVEQLCLCNMHHLCNQKFITFYRPYQQYIVINVVGIMLYISRNFKIYLQNQEQTVWFLHTKIFCVYSYIILRSRYNCNSNAKLLARSTENFKKTHLIERNNGISACNAYSFLLKGGLD